MSFFKHLKQYVQDLEALADNRDKTYWEVLGGIYKAGRDFGKRDNADANAERKEGNQHDQN